MKCVLMLAAFVFTLVPFAAAQPSLRSMNQQLAGEKPSPSGSYRTTLINPSQLAIRFNGPALYKADVKNWLQTKLALRPGTDELVDKGRSTRPTSTMEVLNLQQYFRGIKVEHGIVNITCSNGRAAMMQLEFYSIPGNLPTSPAIPENTALMTAALSMQVPDAVIKSWKSGQPGSPAPGELVIVRTYEDDSTVSLAWKFDIFNSQPIARAYVYIDAQTGKLLLQDAIIKHTNAIGTAATRTNGTQAFVTDNGGADAAKPYVLRQNRNGHDIVTLNYQGRIPNGAQSDSLAVDFADNDNNWTAAEFNNSQQDNAALDVHFNMQIVSDYWKTVHNRSSWDDANAPLRSYIHVASRCNNDSVPMDNAFWSGSAMYYGDGSFGTTGNGCTKNFKPLVCLDVTAHEVGHAISQSANSLIYRWESGALSESFSDMWGAIIEQWGKEQNATISAGKSTWLIGEEMTGVPGKGIRNMQAPGTGFSHPSTYHDALWQFCTFRGGCFPTNNNDNGGVHTNSGVINKWFYLVTEGEAGNNTMGVPYNVTGMGMVKSRNLIYLTALNLTPNAGFSTAMAVSLNAAVALYGTGSAELETVKSAWRAVGVDSATWNISNTPAFAASNNESFTSIAVDAYDRAWAGTDKKGLYLFDGSSWKQRVEIDNVKINDIKVDKEGGAWVAQSGTVNSSLATAGGVNYFADPDTAMTAFYTNSTEANIPSRNVRSIFLDLTRTSGGSNPRVWIGTNPFMNDAGNFVSGKPAVGPLSSIPNFTPVTGGLDVSTTANGTPAIGGNKDVIWTFASNNNGKKQLLSYNSGTGTFLAAHDNSTNPLIPVSFSVTAIYTDILKRTWFGLTSNAVLVIDQYGAWHYISVPTAFVPGSQVNPNAITGTKFGDVYIGTTAGLIFYDQDNNTANALVLDNAANYKLFIKQNGLPSSNITGIAFDARNFKVWIATDKGICRWDPLCLGDNCNVSTSYLTNTAHTAQSGNWSDTATWEDKKIPDSNTMVYIENNIVVDINGQCLSLQVFPGSSVRINTGRNLTVFKKPDDIIISGEGDR